VERVRLSKQFRRLSIPDSEVEQKISFFKALMLPRVMLYSSAFFCTKMAVYILLLWLPTFLKESKLRYNDNQVANLSTVIDLGAMFGSMALGYISDLMYGKRSPVALGAVLISITISFVVTYNVYSMSAGLFFVLMFFLGFFISGLNNMISSACSADLGKQDALKGNARAISTVTGIIDGTGTLGSAAG
jgi:sugar phosphate permease